LSKYLAFEEGKSTEIIKHGHEKFQMYAHEVRIRPLGHAIEAHVNVNLDPETKLKEIHMITNSIKQSIIEEFKLKDVVVVPVPKS
jgi:divalent metal cation (Fe/Co/Zn/Cd) transporter